MAFGTKKRQTTGWVRRNGQIVNAHTGQPYNPSGGGTTGGLDAASIAAALLAAQQAEAAASQGYTRTQADYESQARLEAALQQQMQERQFAQQMEQERVRQAFEMEQERLRREAEERQRVAQLRQERDTTFSQLYNQDPVRSILFGRGMAGDLVTGATRFDELGKLSGIEQREGEVEAALQKAIGGPNQYDIDLHQAYGNRAGVANLPSAEQVARQTQFGGENVSRLLQSAFGIGGGGLGGGITAEEFLRRVQEVTPTGELK